MTKLEMLEEIASDEGIILDYSLLECYDCISGLYIDLGQDQPKVIMINRHRSLSQQLAVLAEELGHHYASHGDIVSLRDVVQRKQEAYGRAWAFERLLPPGDVFTACLEGEGTPWELSERFGLPEAFIREALEYYSHKLGGAAPEQVKIHVCRLPA